MGDCDASHLERVAKPVNDWFRREPTFTVAHRNDLNWVGSRHRSPPKICPAAERRAILKATSGPTPMAAVGSNHNVFGKDGRDAAQRHVY